MFPSMFSSVFSLIFVSALALALALQIWLARRQIKHVRAHRHEVPSAFRESVSLATHQRAADYTVAKTRLGIAEQTVASLLLLGWTLGGGLNALDRFWYGLGLSPLMTGVGFMLSVIVLASLLDLPLAAYRTFGLERRFGFNRTSPGLFVSDTLKQLVLLLLLGAPLAWVVLALMAQVGSLWWFYAWLAWMGFSLLLTWAYPRLIAPLFNRFTPLQDTELQARIDGLLVKSGFHSGGVYVMDGSRRSTHGNAYFTGLGRQKRIVFFDTLLHMLKAEEIEAVLAHELGHFRLRHVRKTLLWMGTLSLAGLALLGWLSEQTGFYQGLGMERPSDPAALVLFVLVLSVFGTYLAPVFAYFSRKREFEADDFAARYSDPQSLITALVKLYKENANTLTPDPLYSAFHDSHPPAPARVAHLLSKQAAPA